MLTDSIVTGFMEASITGAGLVLAVYALIIPMSSRIFKELDREIKDNAIEFLKIKNNITPESKKEMKKLKNLSKNMERLKKLPAYLFIGVFITFTFYCISTLVDALWFINSNINEGSSIVILFATATAVFFIVGIMAVVLVFIPMQNEFVAITKRQKKVSLKNSPNPSQEESST